MDCIFAENVISCIILSLPERSTSGMIWINLIEKFVVLVLNILIMCCYIGLTLNVIEGRECIMINIVYAIVLVIITIMYKGSIKQSNKVVIKKDLM